MDTELHQQASLIETRLLRSMIGKRQIGGARVVRPFSFGGRRLLVGETLTAAQVEAMPISNLRALIDNRQLALETIAPGATSDAPPTGELHVVHRGAGAYDVIFGRRLNDEPLTKEEAQLLAAGQAQQPS